VYDARGSVVESGYGSPSNMHAPKIEQELAFLQDLRPFEPSALAREAADRLGRGGYFPPSSDDEDEGDEDEEEPPVSAPLLAALTQPESRDPLSFLHSEVLIEIGRQKGAQVVAALGDDMIPNTPRTAHGAPVDARRMVTAMMADAYRLDLQDGWLTLAPLNPEYTEDKFIDRAAMGSLLLGVVQRGPTMWEYANVAWQASWYEVLMEDFEYHPMIPLLMGQFGGMNTGEWGNGTWARFLGSLAQGQRSALLQGGVRIGTLNPVQLQALSDCYYRLGMSPFPDAITDDAPDYMGEITEAMPNGLDPAGTLRMTSRQAQVLVPEDMEMVMTAKQLAAGLLLLERQTSGGKGSNDEELADWIAGTKFSLGSASRHTLVAQPIPQFSHEASFTFWSTGRDRFTIDRMPQNVRSVVDGWKRQLAGLDKDTLQSLATSDPDFPQSLSMWR
jgi:hypothetical protein